MTTPSDTLINAVRHLRGKRGGFAPDLGFEPPEWTFNALCAQVDAEMFFPEKGESNREAKLICGRCDVTAECLAYAMDNNERYGIWGQLSERERRRLARTSI